MASHPLLFIALGGLGAWLVFRPKTANAKVNAEAGMPPALPPKQMKIDSTPAKVPTLDDSPSASAGNYLTHLSNAADKLNTIANGDIGDPAVHQAFDDLQAPMDVLTVQKDLNVLGAMPPVVEDGVYGPKTKDAIDSFQRAMNITPTGVMNANTNQALRRAVVAATVVTPQGT